MIDHQGKGGRARGCWPRWDPEILCAGLAEIQATPVTWISEVKDWNVVCKVFHTNFCESQYFYHFLSTQVSSVNNPFGGLKRHGSFGSTTTFFVAHFVVHYRSTTVDDSFLKKIHYLDYLYSWADTMIVAHIVHSNDVYEALAHYSSKAGSTRQHVRRVKVSHASHMELSWLRHNFLLEDWIICNMTTF